MTEIIKFTDEFQNKFCKQTVYLFLSVKCTMSRDIAKLICNYYYRWRLCRLYYELMGFRGKALDDWSGTYKNPHKFFRDFQNINARAPTATKLSYIDYFEAISDRRLYLLKSSIEYVITSCISGTVPNCTGCCKPFDCVNGYDLKAVHYRKNMSDLYVRFCLECISKQSNWIMRRNRVGVWGAYFIEDSHVKKNVL